MASLVARQVIAGAVGLVYAVIYGFWTMLATGGGHGNFVWIGLFLFVEFFGLYFPLMCVLAVNLRSFFIKILFGSLIAFNLIASTIMILGWMTETEPLKNGMTDFQRMMEGSGIWSLILCAAAHFLPTIVFAFLLVRSILFGQPLGDHDQTETLGLR